MPTIPHEADLKILSYFQRALKNAKRAAGRNEIPIGAVLVKNGEVIASAFNQTERFLDFTAHAEMLCFAKARKKLKTKYLVDCDLYLTLEPCSMCLGAARLQRIRTITYLLKSPKFGRSGKALFKTKVQKISWRNPLVNDAHQLLRDFFKLRR